LAIRRLTDFSVKPAKAPALERPICIGNQQVGVITVDADRRLSFTSNVPMTHAEIERVEAALLRVMTRILPKSGQ
jgi:hypothetical protein